MKNSPRRPYWDLTVKLSFFVFIKGSWSCWGFNNICG